MRKAAGTLLVAALLAVGSTWFVGMRVERACREHLDRLSALPNVRILEVRYDRGWLTSELRVGFEVLGLLGEDLRTRLGGDEGAVRDRLGFRVWTEVVHGPLPLWRWIHGDSSEIWALAIADSRISLDRETKLDLEAIAPHLPAGAVRVVVRRDRVTGRVELGPLQVPTPSGDLGLDALEADLRFPADLAGAALDAALPRLVLSRAGRRLVLEGLAFAADFERRPDGLAAALDLGIDSARVGEGRPVPVSLELAVQGLEPAGLRALALAWLADDAAGAWEPRLVEILRGSPAVSKAQLRVGEGEGDLVVRGRLSVDGGRIGDHLDRNLWGAFEGQAGVLVAEPMFEGWTRVHTRLVGPGIAEVPGEVPLVAVDGSDAIAAWLGAGLLEFDGERYRATFSLNDGALRWSQRRFELRNTGTEAKTLPQPKPLAQIPHGR